MGPSQPEPTAARRAVLFCGKVSAVPASRSCTGADVRVWACPFGRINGCAPERLVGAAERVGTHMEGER